MDRQILLTIPDYVYKQAEQIAESEVRSPNDVLSDILVQAFPTVYAHPQQEEMLQEQAAFQRMLDDLLPRYNEEYVAVHGGKVIDHDPDAESLVERINARYPSAVVLIKKVTPEPDRIIHLRSPRLVR